MVYKIGLISTHGTGKTTMAHLLAGELKRKGFRVKVIPEVATEARETGKIIDEATRLIDQAWILLTQARYELEAELGGYKIIICDRTVHDNYCYLENSCGPNESYKTFVKNHAKEHPYKVLYRIPIVCKLQADGSRAASEVFQLTIDHKLSKYLEEENIESVELPPLKDEDSERNEWIRFIVQKTLDDLNVFKRYETENTES